MKLSLITLSILLIVSCGKQSKEENNDTNNETVATTAAETKKVVQEIPILVGLKERKDLEAEPYASLWYNQNFDEYTMDTVMITQVKPLLNDVDKITIFMGTWCGDSKRGVPPFFKILDEAEFDMKKVSLITVTRDKDTPENYEEGLNITNVPTFILYKEGKEINRIVESPIETWEKDIWAILSGSDYKHTYAE